MALSLIHIFKAYAETQYTGEAFERGRKSYTHAQPFTKESLLYRDIFEKYYPGQSQMVVDFWMPNKEWEGCDVDDPSARVLSNYCLLYTSWAAMRPRHLPFPGAWGIIDRKQGRRVDGRGRAL